MRSLVSAELLKLRSTRSAWIPLAAALAMAVVAVVASTTVAGHDGSPHLSAAALPGLLRGSGGQLLDGAVLLCWIVLSAGEFRPQLPAEAGPARRRDVAPDRPSSRKATAPRCHRRQGTRPTPGGRPTGSIVFDGGSRISRLCAAEAAHSPRTSAAHNGTARVLPCFPCRSA